MKICRNLMVTHLGTDIARMMLMMLVMMIVMMVVMMTMMVVVMMMIIMVKMPRILMAYPAGYQYGQYHHHDYLYPKYGWCVTN